MWEFIWVALLKIRRERIVHWFQKGWVAAMADIRLRVETEVEDDGRWIAEVLDLPGVMAYGATENEAVASAHALALRVHADPIGG
jgi:predicted RNase H-like HicB family nuclease